ncbi:MAG TPA: 50S ribosomal protein L6 [Verrucomicrobiales bacterium]|nr:50S ribosomal protein L6 [Verrucomicrobiales bacterium]
MSRIGLQTIPVPDKVSVAQDGRQLTVEGPMGRLEWSLPRGIGMREEAGVLTLQREGDSRQLRALHGTARSLVANMVRGVSAGFSKDLEIQGVGFRAAVKGEVLDLSIGKSHPVVYPIPPDLKVTVTENTKIRVEGVDKQRVGQFAAEVRSAYPPEPYKGKGIRYAGEYVRRKAGKNVKK